MALTEADFEAIARSAHSSYLNFRGLPPGAWEDLTARQQASNLDSARFAPTILAALGLRVDRGDDPGRRRELTAEEVEAGARLEHLRWCRFTRASGRIEHPDLIPWDGLDEFVRDLDRIRIRPLPGLLHDLGYSLMETTSAR